jgi:hypothetical protein
MSVNFPEPYTGEGDEGFEPIPPGEYIAQAIEGHVGPPKTGNGMALSLTGKIIDGDYENRQVWQNISFIHPRAGAQWHGQRKLNAIIAAVGATLPLTTVEPLLFRPVLLGLAIEKDANGVYPDKNIITKIMRLDGEAEEAAQPAPVKPAQSQPARPEPSNAGAAPPWHRR